MYVSFLILWNVETLRRQIAQIGPNRGHVIPKRLLHFLVALHDDSQKHIENQEITDPDVRIKIQDAVPLETGLDVIYYDIKRRVNLPEEEKQNRLKWSEKIIELFVLWPEDNRSQTSV